MTALKAKWSEMSLYRRVLLIVMAIEILAFFFATLVMINRPGLEYQDAMLYPGTEGDIQIYQGTVDGETARFAVSPEWEVSYQWGDYTYGPYQITEDPAAVPDGYEGSQGIEIRLGDEVLFRGVLSPQIHSVADSGGRGTSLGKFLLRICKRRDYFGRERPRHYTAGVPRA